jgi:hypothetical protein
MATAILDCNGEKNIALDILEKVTKKLFSKTVTNGKRII